MSIILLLNVVLLIISHLPATLVQIFSEQELELILSGSSNIDADDWRRNTQYAGGYSSNNQVRYTWLRFIKTKWCIYYSLLKNQISKKQTHTNNSNVQFWKMPLTINMLFISQTIIWFWKCVSEMSETDKSSLLQFCTGSSRVPYKGFKQLHGSKFVITQANGDNNDLPTASTW